MKPRPALPTLEKGRCPQCGNRFSARVERDRIDRVQHVLLELHAGCRLEVELEEWRKHEADRLPLNDAVEAVRYRASRRLVEHQVAVCQRDFIGQRNPVGQMQIVADVQLKVR